MFKIGEGGRVGRVEFVALNNTVRWNIECLIAR